MYVNKYPYSNFHELNDDWILWEMRKLQKRVDNLSPELQEYVNTWLEEHPEATTTVQDGAVTAAKLSAGLRAQIAAAALTDALDTDATPFATFVADGLYTNSQCMCVAGPYLIVSRSYSDPAAGPVRLYVISIAGRSVLSYADYNIGHSNSLCYNPADGCVYASYGVNAYKIRLNGSTLGTMETIPLPWACNCITCYDGVFYLARFVDSSLTRVLYSTEDFSTFTECMTLAAGTFDGEPQGMCADENFIYFCRNGSNSQGRIYVIGKGDWQVVRTYFLDTGSLGELEDVDIYDGNIFINFKHSLTSSAVYAVRLYDDAPAVYPDPIAGYKGHFNRPDVLARLYVDNSITVAFPFASTVSGAGESTPFNRIQDAVALMQRLNLPAVIYVKGTYDDVYLYGVNVALQLSLDSAVISRLRVHYSNPVILTGSGTIGTIDADNSTVTLNGDDLVLDGSTAADITNAVYAVRAVITGRVGTIQNYDTALNLSRSIVNLAYTSASDVTTMYPASNSTNLRCINGQIV